MINATRTDQRKCLQSPLKNRVSQRIPERTEGVVDHSELFSKEEELEEEELEEPVRQHRKKRLFKFYYRHTCAGEPSVLTRSRKAC